VEALLVYCEDSELNLFQILQMIRAEVETLASVDWVSINSGSHCRLFPDDQIIPKTNHTDYFLSGLDGRP
jgi:hypothetical protein